MVKVKGAESLEYLFAHLLAGFLYARRSNCFINGTAHEAAHAVAQKAAHRIEGQGRQGVAREGVVDGGGEVGQGVKQRAVEVENESCVHIVVFCFR